ncbi:RagB/SusD family nutrient uptake outer membrane protein [Gillisia hiemivivida]|uniref:RagB/SusD family nutrient uptake outer membrane protein n=1 Tax=Gillisia hiemivivida TaxID=291190 RepID=A0A5C7A038_9FLAO|nr:RagB/SusD family nutrient uptake outer membrane protein [Gillisia hiemivivida]
MKMKINTLKKRIIFTLVAFIAISCSDDFVDVTSENESADNYFNSEEEYQQALIGAYDLLQATYLNVMIGEIASDNTLAGGESANDVIGFQQIDKMSHTPVNQQLRDVWNWMFAGVNRANYILQFQDKTDFEGRSEVIAQARFLRAYYYFELVKFFGDVPLFIDKPLEFGEQFDIVRTPRAEVYDQIEADLIFAAENLPATQAQTGRITSGAANALLGKAYLYQEQFTEAAASFEKVISGPYTLAQDYESIFEPEGENGPGSVFEIQYTDKEGAGFGCLQCSEGNVAVGFNGIRNFTGPIFGSGFSFNLPVQDVVDAFSENDIRKDVAILDIDAFANATGATFIEGFEHTGYYNRKYLARQGDLNTGDANLTNPNNYRSIRFADVLLMAAEANFKKSPPDEGKAREYLNRVRVRAQLDPVDFVGSILLDQIYIDRRLELVGEGHRFFDLVRTGRAASEIDGFVAGKHELFPIPAIEIELAGNNWEQNPNY